MRRQVMEQLEQRKDQLVQALWANSNYDDDKGTRQTALQEIEANYEETIEQIINGTEMGPKEEEAEDVDFQNPFFAPTKKAMDKIQVPGSTSGTVRDALGDENSYKVDIDQ